MFEQVKQEIDNKIKTNGNNEITATRLNGVLQDMMDATAEELSGYVQKTDPPSPAAGDIVVFDEFGGLGTSEKTVNDFATASQGAKADTALQPTGVKTINNQSIVGSGNIMIEGGGTDDYADLDNKPQINSVTLNGNKSVSDLGLATAAQGAKADTAVQPSALNDYVQKSQTTGLLKNDGTVDTQTAGRAESALQPLSGAQENNFASFDANGNLQDSNCNESTFIKGVQQNGTDLTPDANGKVNVTVQDGEDGLSAFEIAQQQGYTGTVDQWLASLKANIGAFKFVNTVAAVQTQFETDGVGSVYTSSIDGVTADATTLSVILLMTTSGLSPEKTYMIATQDDGNSGYEFVYAGDLQSAMPSNVLTKDDVVNDSTTGGADKPWSAEQGVVLAGKVSQLEHEVNGKTTFTRGQIDTTTGNVDTTSTTRAYSPQMQNPGKVYFPTTIKVSPRYYDAQGVYQGYDDWFTNGEATLNTTHPTIRLVVAYSDNATITDAAAFNSIVQIKCVDTRLNVLETGLASVPSQIAAVENKVFVDIYPDFEIGTIDGGTGQDSANNTRVRCGMFSLVSGISVIVKSGYKFSLRWYKDDGTFVISTNWITEDTVLSAPNANCKKFRLVAADTSDSTITDASTFKGKVYVHGLPENLYDLLGWTPDEIKSLDVRVKVLETNFIVRQDTNFVLGNIDNTGTEKSDGARCRSVFFKVTDISDVSCLNGYKYSYRWYDSQKNYITTILSWRTTKSVVSEVAPNNAVYFRIVAANSDDSSISTVSAMDTVVFVYASLSSEIVKMENDVQANKTAIQALQQEKVFSSSSSVGNCSIIAAKQHTFSDGTPPLYEWFLLADPDNNLYLSRDLATRTFLCAFADNVSNFAFGILPNGDIIACKMASALSSGGSDDNRVNPYVFKASEGWAVKHEVNFGTSLKPCGWLENCGFTTLPGGTAMFAEYTRVTVATCNCWKIVGDASDPTNWVVKKSFTLSGQPDSGFKHAHMVTVDFYTGVIYLATGDDNVGAMVFASTDGGDTWTQLREGSELYCRMLMMTFTEDYIYWAQDTPGQHYFYRGERDVNGVLDYSTVTQFVTIPGNGSNYFASYGQAYLPEYDAVLLLDRQDSGDSGQTLPIRAITLSDGQIHTVGTIEATDGGNIGFRTSFSEWYPVGGLIRVGFGFSGVTVNKNKVCGNKWPVNSGRDSVNNLWMKVGYDGTNWTVKFGTYYL